MAKKVFISYAHESEELSDSVLDFSNYLRSQGIDSEIDQYEESPPEGWPKWMMRQVQEADYVLVVCSRLFYERANDFSGKSEGSGVKWETNLILQQLYGMNTNNDKFIPVVFDRKSIDFIPLPLQPYTHYCVVEDSQKFKLRDRLLGISKSKRPELGQPSIDIVEPKPLEPKERKSMFFSSIIDVELWDRARWNAMTTIIDPAFQSPPVLGFVFADNKVGNEIFKRLKKQFGYADRNNEIRVSIIHGISSSRPHDYKVHFGLNWEPMLEKMEAVGFKPDESVLMTMSRIHEMNPDNDNSISMFKSSFEYFKECFITNVSVDKKRGLVPCRDNMIKLNTVHFRTKADVLANENDPDCVVFGVK
ncbi:hypothetical protein UA38_19945 [Photobacterium kishitanii]|uniref:TIR domain-containing protein n=1 Tax=Photobacterium kishitanii TaxID=318456 RepID=A0AAX0YSR1_9GAMM|nr:SEFIR domain-containing protein [Photobacterium kishitanii]KJG55406.1 hypothetical protein UA38_19945 [Photobacterium kishitanii]KJG56748.1 hypothetical protein UA42_22130 [Photobacterium kishitanii]KJG63421.1 hypothetical protein UA40_22045 [Photobacterium kishitanii]KJG66561.1 hypothetical protein UA41_20700 [Photobacterium kishitanii]PSX18250.1 TIR domain-containing protein [Photobacterium kishitanii]